MPLDLAVFGINKAEAVKAAYPQIKTWVLAGHSLGGAMAANYLYKNPDAARALILWGSFPAESNDLSQSGLAVLSIYGSEDGGAAEIAASQERLPGDALFMFIQGGNHAQFGDYGEQKGDGQALIPAADQRELALQSMLGFLDKLEN
jgi:pimeloyl-ACP methyl ester carboxylesterase